MKSIYLSWNSRMFERGQGVGLQYEVKGYQTADDVRAARQSVNLLMASAGFRMHDHWGLWVAQRVPFIEATDLVKRLQGIGYTVEHGGDVPHYFQPKQRTEARSLAPAGGFNGR